MPIFLCPNDNTEMREINRDGVLVDICPTCRGVWLDRGELEKLLGSIRAVEADWDREREGYRRAESQPAPYRPDERDRRDSDDRDRDDRNRDGRRRRRGLSDLFDIFD